MSRPLFLLLTIAALAAGCSTADPTETAFVSSVENALTTADLEPEWGTDDELITEGRDACERVGADGPLVEQAPGGALSIDVVGLAVAGSALEHLCPDVGDAFEARLADEEEAGAARQEVEDAKRERDSEERASEDAERIAEMRERRVEFEASSAEAARRREESRVEFERSMDRLEELPAMPSPPAAPVAEPEPAAVEEEPYDHQCADGTWQPDASDCPAAAPQGGVDYEDSYPDGPDDGTGVICASDGSYQASPADCPANPSPGLGYEPDPNDGEGGVPGAIDTAPGYDEGSAAHDEAVGDMVCPGPGCAVND